MHLSRPYSLPTVPLVKHLTFECIAVESNILGRTTGLSGPVYGDAPHVVSLCQGLRVKNARRMRLLQAEPCSEDQGWPYLQRYLAWDVERRVARGSGSLTPLLHQQGQLDVWVAA